MPTRRVVAPIPTSRVTSFLPRALRVFSCWRPCRIPLLIPHPMRFQKMQLLHHQVLPKIPLKCVHLFTSSVGTYTTQFMKNLDKIPCARNSLLTGIAGGAGMAFIRGMTVGADLQLSNPSNFDNQSRRILQSFSSQSSHCSRALVCRNFSGCFSGLMVCFCVVSKSRKTQLCYIYRHLCQAKIESERQKVAQIIESGPKRTLKKDSDTGTVSLSASTSNESSKS